MRRRDFIILVSGAVSFHTRANAQSSSTPLIGYLSSKDEAAEATVIKGMSVGLADQGIILGKDAALTARWSAGQYERLPALAADLIAAKVDVLVTSGLPATMAAKADWINRVPKYDWNLDVAAFAALFRNELMQQLKFFRRQRVKRHRDACQIAARTVKATHKPLRSWSAMIHCTTLKTAHW